MMTLRHSLELRAATAADAPGLSRLLAAAGRDVSARDLTERLAALRQGPATALVAVQWGPPSGLVVVHWHPVLEEAAPVARITTLLVEEEDRRRGIGRLLVKGAAQAARLAGCDRIEIEVPPGLSSLRAFCRATGFAEAGAAHARSLRRQG